MIGQDLRSALQAYEACGQLLRVAAPVHWRYEAAAVLWKLADGPAVVFDDVVGYDMPLVGNVLNNRRKLAIALGSDVAAVQDRIVAAVHDARVPEPVPSPPCQEVVQTADLDVRTELPVPMISEHDAGRYISAGLVTARSPDGGRRNLAICRIQVRDDGTLGCYLAPTHTSQFLQRAGELRRPLEVAVAIGNHPAWMTASQMLVPGDEFEHAGALFGAPAQVAQCVSVDLQVPAGAELVLEGVIDPDVRVEEGPFGEFPGRYAPRRPGPVIELRAITRRRDAMFQMIVGGMHPEHLVTGALAREAALLDALRRVVPGTQEVLLTEGGTCRFHAVVKIRKRVEGEGKLAITAALANQDLLKHAVVVDDDIDIHDHKQVEWAVATRSRAHDDVLLLPGMKSNPVDPMSVGHTVTKMGIDATLPAGQEQELPVPAVPGEVTASITRRWAEITGAL
jgi:2,5-furandicarboxylate decarboxylase 1